MPEPGFFLPDPFYLVLFSPDDKKEPDKKESGKKNQIKRSPGKKEPDKKESGKKEPDKKELGKKEEYQKTKQEALDSLRYQFFIAKMAEEKKIQVSKEEMDEGIKQMAKSYGVNPVQLMQNEYSKQLSDILRSQLEENKILDFIRKEAKRV